MLPGANAEEVSSPTGRWCSLSWINPERAGGGAQEIGVIQTA
jgi:hypothetical protein